MLITSYIIDRRQVERFLRRGFVKPLLIKTALMLLTIGYPFLSKTQIPDNLYNSLSANIKPRQPDNLTVEERLNILKSLFNQDENEYKSETDVLLKTTLADINEEKDLSKRVPQTFIIVDLLSGNEAIKCYTQLIEAIGNTKGYEKELGKAYLDMAAPYIYADRFDSAMSALQEALYYVEKQNNNDLSGEIYQTFTVIYGKLGLYKKALEYSKRAVGFFKNGQNKRYYIQCAITCGYMYAINFEKNAQPAYLDTARSIIRDVMRSEKNDAGWWYAGCYQALGYFDYLQTDYKSALPMFDSSLLPAYNIESRYNPNYYYFRYLYKGVCFIKTGNIPAGEQMLLNLKVTNKSYQEQLIRYTALYESSKEKGDYKNALYYHELSKLYSDSLSLEDQKGVIFEAEQKYAAAQKEKTIARMETEKVRTQARYVKIFSFVIIALLLAAVAALIFYLRARWQRANFLGFKLNVARNIHDETGPALLYAKVLAKTERLKQNETVKSELELHLDHTMEIIRSLSHDLKSEEQFTTTSLVMKCKEVLKKLNFNNDFTYDVTDKTNSNRFLSHFQFTNLKSILQECITNTIKHADFSAINIDFIKNGNKLRIVYFDNGKGWEIGEKPAGIGMTNIKERVSKLNGEFSLDNNYPNGYRLRIDVLLQ